MKLQDETIKEIKQLPPNALSRVYDFILSIRKEYPQTTKRTVPAPYLRARNILKKCKGSMAEDIINARRDRI